MVAMAESSSDNICGVIDAHVHITTPFRLAGLMRWVRSFNPNHQVPVDVDEKYILHDMKSLGTRYFFNLIYPLRRKETGTLNKYNYDITCRLPNSAGWGSLHPRNERKAEITRQAIEQYGFIGMKLHPFVQKFSITDSCMSPLYETLSELKRPLFIHTGFDEFYEMKLTAEQISGIAGDYPDMPIIISHTLFPRLDKAIELMGRHEQIIGDLTNVPGAIRYLMGNKKNESLSKTEAGKLLAAELPAFADRLLFGTDHPAGIGTYNSIYNDFYDLGLPVELEKKITWSNPMNMVRKYLPGRWD